MTTDPLERYIAERVPAWARKITLRPMYSGEVLETSLQIYQLIGIRILKLTATPAVLAFLGLAFITQFVMPYVWLTSDNSSISNQVLEALITVAMGLFLALPIILIGVSYSTGITISLVSDFLLGGVPDDDTAIRTGRRILKKMFGFTVVQSLIALLPVLGAVGMWMLGAATSKPGSTGDSFDLSAAFAIAGILGVLTCFIIVPYVVFRYSICPQIIIHENKSTRAALSRSSQLIKGGQGHLSGYNTLFSVLFTIGFLFLLILPGAMLGLEIFDFQNRLRDAFSMPFIGVVLSRILQHLPTFLTVWVLVPIWTTVTTILYFDRRARHEGFDIELLAQSQRQRSHATRFRL